MSRLKRHAAKGQREEAMRLSSKIKEKKKGTSKEAEIAVQFLQNARAALAARDGGDASSVREALRKAKV